MALIDSLDLGPQLPGVAQGRLPDGATNLVLFPVSSSPGEGNYLPLTNVVINEILTLPSSVREQAIELLSLANVTLPIGGWYLSDCQSEPKKFRIPTNTTLAPNGFRVFYENQFNPTPGVLPSFSMNGACGGELHLYEADLAGQLTGRRTSVKFGAAETGVSFGRIFISSGPIFTALKQTTFGADWAGSVAQFRAGTGQHNAKARIGPIVINEIMYQPVSATGNGLEEDQLDEFVELLNVTTEDVPLYDPAFPEHTWRLRDGVNYSFPPNTVIPSFGYLLVVNFDPVNEPWVMAAFCEKYGLPTSTPMVGPFNGRLKNEGETLELIKPGSLVITGSCAGLIPGIIMDRASYRPTAPWPAAAAGGGASLQRRIPVKHGEDSVAWKAEPATTARVNIHVGSPPPVITLQPSDVIAPVGGTVIFSAEATDAGLVTYQWRQNGLPLSGATNATLILTNVQLASGGFYQAWIEGDGGTIATRAALLTVVEPPVITSQPRCITNHAGATVQFSVTATGTAPIQFQWFRNGQPLLNATNPVLTLTSVGAYSVGGYHVVIANPGGSTTSHVATLTIAALDCDNDGMPDSWEQAHGLNPLNPVDADLDSDGDGMRNRDEFTAGTDPTDPQSLLKLESSPTSPTSGRIGFRFIAAPGYSYTVQVRETLQSGWTKVLDVPAEATAREVRFDAPSSGGAKFFRIVTPIQP